MFKKTNKEDTDNYRAFYQEIENVFEKRTLIGQMFFGVKISD